MCYAGEGATKVGELGAPCGADEGAELVDDVELAAGESKMVRFELTRRDVSNWDTARQDWVVNDHEKFVFVGYSSAKIALNSTLPALK